uniref:Molybdopterin biosynthesis protein n=1 Tax=Apophlaea sinclairii TaxID=212746 RepID=A0A1C9CBP8_9FLOR|nr:molybdopterin biosynthesis protein [Apophlaea sinclairii]AOM65820.1 molybdopterin biosynthesis protein [Apophlaea sinclairii]
MLNPYLNNISFTEREYKRYTRNLKLSSIGIHGQKRLKTAQVLCVGIGGLGSVCLLYLVASGIENIGIIDKDVVNISNLQRQIIYKTADVTYKKVKCVKKSLEDINPECKIHIYYEFLNEYNSKYIIPKYDIIIDGTDNWKSKEIISNTCRIFNKPHIYGAIGGFIGQISVFNYQSGPTYRDLYLQHILSTTEDCSTNGVLGVLPGIIGTLQATEVIKIITGMDSVLSGYLLIYNILNTSFKKIRLRKIISSTNINNLPYTNLKYTLSFKQSQYRNNTKVLLVDVRKSHEYQLNHIENSINIPLRLLKYQHILSFLTSQSYTKTIYIYCNHNSQSTAALSLLLKNGITCYKFLAK